MKEKTNYKNYLKFIKDNLNLALGCTEPASMALASSSAYEQIEGKIIKIDAKIGINMYKNALYVGIPGVTQKGIDMAILLGIFSKNSKNGLEIFNGLSKEIIEQAELSRNKVNIDIKNDIESVYVDITIYTENGKARCKIERTHTNITLLEVNDKIIMQNDKKHTTHDYDPTHDYEDFLNHIHNIDVDEFDYIEEGIKKLDEIIAAGLEQNMPLGIGSALNRFMKNGLLSGDVINNTAIKIAAAAEARLSGYQCSVMSCGGSGSQGMATILPILQMAQHTHVVRTRMIRGIVVGYGTTLYAKRVLGKLSCVCGCAIASSIGATTGMIWMQGGGHTEIQGGINNVIGSLTGVICDGAKIGCAFKMAMGATMSVYSALLAVDNVFLDRENGIIGESISETISNLGKISHYGMKDMNSVIVDIMKNKCTTKEKCPH